eukprot:scaffold685_cov62-Isochrysis_galbana.AAC.1
MQLLADIAAAIATYEATHHSRATPAGAFFPATAGGATSTFPATTPATARGSGAPFPATAHEVGAPFPATARGGTSPFPATGAPPPLPFITASYAQGLDGSMCGPLGAQGPRLLLSGAAAMALTHRLRAAHGAILVGVGTILADDPKLNVRLAPGPSPVPVVIDSTLRTPVDCQMLQVVSGGAWGGGGGGCGGGGIGGGGGRGCGGESDHAGRAIIITLRQTLDSPAGARRANRLRAHGATVLG